MDFPSKLQHRLGKREESHALRTLRTNRPVVDFSSNDYLGFARSQRLFDEASQKVSKEKFLNGASGSRLLSGHHIFHENTENAVAAFHKSESALLFNSGYDANLGFFASVPQRGDVILYDELCHASIRDGIGLSNAKAYKFGHNDLEDLSALIAKFQAPEHHIYIVTESVFSMDGDSPNLEELARTCRENSCYGIVDEAHALGVFGENGCGLVQSLGLEEHFFARLVTFGKGLGCHGSAVLGSAELKSFLVNFARSFIYTTALPAHSVATISSAYEMLSETSEIAKLRENIAFLNREKNRLGLKPMFVYSKSAIQSAIVPGNEKVRELASALQNKGFDVRAILSPTVPQGQERLRICLHSFNSEAEISALLLELTQHLF